MIIQPLKPLALYLVSLEQNAQSGHFRRSSAYRTFVMVFFSLQGLNQKQFLEMYKRAYPHALNSKRLANSVFRLCDRNIDGIIDFTEFAASICIPPTRYVYNTLYQCPS